jgi:hypothetical protein
MSDRSDVNDLTVGRRCHGADAPDACGFASGSRRPPGLPDVPRRSLWVFRVTGLAALLWFCLRVLPKPSRARYPCQRVAFPLASGFVVWLLGAVGSLAVMRRARRSIAESRYVLAGVLVAAAVAVLVVASGAVPEPAPASAHVGVPNVPLGTARGLHPGRVVWVRDPNAVTWAGPGTGTPYYDAIDTPVVDNMLDVAITAYAGQADLAGAWDAIIRHFNQQQGKGDVGYTEGEKVFVKANFTLTFDWDRTKSTPAWWSPTWPDREDCVDNTPQLTIALLMQLINTVGVAPSDITIGDPSRIVPDYWYGMVHGYSPDGGYTYPLQNVQFLDRLAGAPYKTATLSAVPFYFSDPDTANFAGVTNQDYVPVSFVEAAYFINFPVLTSHEQSGITLSGKNHYGSLLRNPDAAGYYNEHLTRALEMPGMGNYRAMVDLLGHEEVGGKTLLCLVDGLIGAVSWFHGPVEWDMFPFNADWTNSILVSQDPVAIDSVCFDMLYTEYDSGAAYPWDYPHMAGTEDYLHEAAQASSPPSGAFYDPEHDGVALQDLGAHEHWNDSLLKQYTRNLGTGNGIELLGLMLDLNGQAGNPRPADASSGVTQAAELIWRAGDWALSHDVYFGTDAAAVGAADHLSPEYRGNQAESSHLPGLLDPLTTYYWAIDEVHGSQVWPGAVWSFRTSDGPSSAAATIPQTAVAPAIDGSVDAIWSHADTHMLANENLVIEPFADTGDLTAGWMGLWDANYLYFLVEVTDDHKCNDSSTTWEDDAVELMIDADCSREASYDGVNDYELVFGWGDSTVTLGVNSATNTSGLTFAIANTPSGYVFEAAMPWSAMGVVPAVGRYIGFDAHVVDDDGGGTREGKKAWYATTDDLWQYPQLFAIVELGGRANMPPSVPAGPSPPNNAVGVAVDVDLGWNVCTDPDGDPVTYDVYFGPGGVPSTPVATGLTTPTYDLGLLNTFTTYYWAVVAHDGVSPGTPGPLWIFTTGADTAGPFIDITWPTSEDSPLAQNFITVVGTAQDASTITEIWINGVKATPTSPNYATWAAPIPLRQGLTLSDPFAENVITADGLDELGNYRPDADVEVVHSIGSCGACVRGPTGLRYTGTISADDVDTYQFEAVAGTSLSINLSTGWGGPPCALQLYDPWGVLVLEQTGARLWLSQSLADTGLWTIRVLPSGGVTTDYSLRLSGRAPRTSFYGGGTLPAPDSVGLHPMEALRGSRLRVSASSYSLLPELQVLDPCGHPLPIDSYLSGWGSSVSLWSYPLPDTGEPFETGTYTVCVGSGDGRTGDYTLSCSVRTPWVRPLGMAEPTLLGFYPSDTTARGSTLGLEVSGADPVLANNVVMIGDIPHTPVSARLRSGRGRLYIIVGYSVPLGSHDVYISHMGEASDSLPLTVVP